MSSRIRKWEDGNTKRKRQKRREELTRSQTGALDKFIIKGTNASVENQQVSDIGVSDDNVIDENIEDQNEAENVGVSDMRCDENVLDVNKENDNDDKELEKEIVDHGCIDASHMLDIFDPRNWDGLDSNSKKILMLKGPKRDMSIKKGPKDTNQRRFLSVYYEREMENGEIVDHDWLVYSKELDKVFCFCCKLLKKGHVRGQLVNEGFGDWIHFNNRISEHEDSREHYKNLFTWYDMRVRVEKNETIDKLNQHQFLKEQDHWKNVLFRIVSIVKFLATHNLAFRGSKEKLYEKSNGNFLGLVEMLAEFDPVVEEHVHRIINDKIHVHYLGHKIQNELILLLASKIKGEIISKVKHAKYYSVMLDCTPDISHQEQMSLIVRYVDLSSNSVVVEESFLGFLNVVDTTGEGLFDVLQNELKSLGLDIDNVRGQSYDNGSNMKGKHRGVQKRLLDVNCRAFHVSCGAHSLNLMLCDMANTCGKARDFFGIIQRIYTIFANSTKRWHILKDIVKDLTLKSLSATRWESRISSVKAIRFQVVDVREALLEVADSDNDSKIRHEAKSLAENELGDFEFLVGMVIWYEVLLTVNSTSKYLQSKDMRIDVAIEQIRGLISLFKKYRETGMRDAIDTAEKLASELEIDPVFPQRRKIRRKKNFGENSNDISLNDTRSAEEVFRDTYFYYIVDQAIVSLEKRFEQYQEYENIFGFLFNSENFHMDDMSLQSCCDQLQTSLSNGVKSDIDARKLCMELKLLREVLPNQDMRPFEIIEFLNRVKCFPNASIAYRILLTIPVTVASAERSFSKLKLLKTYLRSTMSQERLNGLAVIAIENDFLENVDYEEMIEDFVTKSVRREALFK